MRIVEINHSAGLTIAQSRPGTDARDCIPPRFRARNVGRIREPKLAVFEHLKTFLAIHDGGELPAQRPIEPTLADRFILRQRSQQGRALTVEDLLHSNDVRPMIANNIEHHLASMGPGVLTVFGCAVTNVERHHADRLGRVVRAGRVRPSRGWFNIILRMSRWIAEADDQQKCGDDLWRTSCGPLHHVNTVPQRAAARGGCHALSAQR